jgi:hypothetical protein
MVHDGERMNVTQGRRNGEDKIFLLFNDKKKSLSIKAKEKLFCLCVILFKIRKW